MASKSKTLWTLAREQRGLYAAGTAAMLAGVLLLYIPPLIVRASIDGLLGSAPSDRASAAVLGVLRAVSGASLTRNLLLAGSLVLLCTALSGVFMYLKGRYAALASERIAKHLRERLYDHLQHLPVAYHDRAQTGDLVQRCTSDVDTVRLFYSTQTVEIARATLLLLTVLPVVLLLDWKLGLLSVALMPVVVFFAIFFFRQMQATFKQVDEAEGAMTATLQENLTGIRVVRAFARQEFEQAKFAGKNVKHRDLNYKLYQLMAVYWSVSDFLCFTQTAIVLLVGAQRVASGYTSVGTLVAFVSYVVMVIWPVRQMGRILSELSKALVAVGRIQEILDTPREGESPAEPGVLVDRGTAGASPSPPIDRVAGQITFSRVSFSHGEKPVLHDVSFRVEPGQTVALLGPSGSGKSTIIQLLLRFYDYAAGSITLDGAELNTIPRRRVRAQFGVVMQEPFLYSKTLRDNLRLGRHTAAEDEVVGTTQMAAIHDSIEQFEKKYDTLVGERGVTLSGGQRQRVAIARALLRDAPVLLLDDALSAVDTHTETLILDALKRRRGRQTTILIAHRLSTLMHADRILVLDHGRIVQSGTHAELLAQPGLYRRLYDIQTALEEDLSRELADRPQDTVAPPVREPVESAHGGSPIVTD